MPRIPAAILTVLLAGLAPAQNTNDDARAAAARAQLDRAVRGAQDAKAQDAARPGSPQAYVDELFARLEQGDHRNARSAAAAALRELRTLGALVVPEVHARFARMGPFARRAAMELLAEHPDPKFTEMVGGMVATDDAGSAVLAAQYLKDLPAAERARLAEVALRSPIDQVRLHALVAQATGGEPMAKILPRLKEFRQTRDGATIQLLRQVLTESKWSSTELLAATRELDALDRNLACIAIDTWCERVATEDEVLQVLRDLAPMGQGDTPYTRVLSFLGEMDRPWWRARIEAASQGHHDHLARLVRNAAPHVEAIPEALVQRAANSDDEESLVVLLDAAEAHPGRSFSSAMLRIAMRDRISDRTRARALRWVLAHDPAATEPVAQALLAEDVLAIPYAQHLALRGTPRAVGVAARILRTKDGNWSGDEDLRGAIALRTDASNLADVLELVRRPASEETGMWSLRLAAAQQALRRWFAPEHFAAGFASLYEVVPDAALTLLETAEARVRPGQDLQGIAVLLDRTLERMRGLAGREQGDVVPAPEVLPVAVRMLLRAGGEGRKRVDALLADPEPEVRTLALEGLLASRPADARAVVEGVLLRADLGDEFGVILTDRISTAVPEVKQKVMARLGGLERPPAQGLGEFLARLPADERLPLVRQMRERMRAVGNEDPGVLLALVAAAGVGAGEDALAFLRELIAHPDVRVRRSTVAQVARLFTKSAVPVLLDALKDPDDEVSGTATQALQRFETYFAERAKWEERLGR